MNHRPRKRFGQHFLTCPSTITHIVDSAMLSQQTNVCEIGPGQGALTELILRRTSSLKVIEIDHNLVRELHSRYPQLDIIQQDALSFDFTTLVEGSVIIGNLPYNVGTPLLLRLLQQANHVQHMILMLQLEVVERLTAQPNSKAYGKLSVICQALCECHQLMTVPPSAFNPPPRVESAVIQIIPYATPQVPLNLLPTLETVLAAAFNQRRKTLSNSLSKHFSNDDLLALSIDPKQRAESLTLNEFVRLAESLQASL